MPPWKHYWMRGQAVYGNGLIRTLGLVCAVFITATSPPESVSCTTRQRAGTRAPGTASLEDALRPIFPVFAAGAGTGRRRISQGYLAHEKHPPPQALGQDAVLLSWAREFPQYHNGGGNP